MGGFCSVALAALVALGAVPASASAQTVEASPWTQFQGDPAHTGAGEEAPEPPYRQAWRFAPKDEVVSGAVIVDDTVIAVGRHGVYGLDAATGELSWNLFRSGGAVATPAVGRAGDRTVVVYVDQPRNEAKDEAPNEEKVEVVAVDAAGTKDELWRTPLEATSRSGVAISGGEAFVGDEDGTVYALGLRDGEIDWTATVANSVLGTPAVAEGAVYVSVRDPDRQRARLVALDAQTGERRWTYQPPSAGGSASALAVGSGLVYAGFADRLVRALSADDGSVAWSSLAISLFSPVAAPAVAGASGSPGAVYIADVAGGLYRLDASTGERAWDHQLNALVVRSSPVVTGSRVLLGLTDGRLVALDQASGDLVWESVASPGLLGAISISPDIVVAVKGGARAGLVAWVHDPDGALVDVPSPTRVDAVALVGRYAAALAIVFLALFVPFHLLLDRWGPVAIAEIPGAGDAEDVEDQV